MRLEDIANLAGVSNSTVSKVVNGKDKGINAETRERVLKVVKEHNYTPYASVLRSGSAKSFLLGVLVDEFIGAEPLLNGMIEMAQRHNYSVLLCRSFGDRKTELQSITKLCKQRVDAVLWQPLEEGSLAEKKHFEARDIPIFLLKSTPEIKGTNVFSFGYQEMAYRATEALVKKGHVAIECITDPGTPMAQAFFRGYERCLFEHQIPLSGEVWWNGRLSDTTTGIVCQSAQIARDILRQASLHNIRVPRNVSIVALTDEQENEQSSAETISYLHIPFSGFGAHITGRMIDEIEKKEPSTKRFSWDVTALSDNGIDVPPSFLTKRIVVIGSLNMDVTIHTAHPPEIGRTIPADSWDTVPGGKGLNQAIGISRLGGRASLIGKVGKDYDGVTIFSLLNENSVDTSGVYTSETVATGKAYINVQNNGESSISIFAGANGCLTSEDLDAYEGLFMEAGFCLLPMELPQETIMHAALLAQKHGVKIILKPTLSSVIADQMLELVDIFVPNRKEAQALCPHLTSVKEQADYFLGKGVNTVIITLGHQGCYIKNKDLELSFPAMSVEALDTTGGADAFIAALATRLSEQDNLPLAVEFATCAAGLSVCRPSVTPALPDRRTVELYLGRKSLY